MAGVTVGGVTHAVSGAQVAIRQNGRLYVQFRPWPPGWEFPGGHIGRDEEAEVSAVREVREETGLSVRILGLVGVYRWAGLRGAGDALYIAEVVSGAPRRTLEAWSHRYVAADDVPRTLFPWIHQRLADALRFTPGMEPVVRVQPITALHVALFGMTWLASPLNALTERLRGRR